ncbi:hypothetical protein SAMN05216486_11023 [bacterium JGI 053]|nr:hypothetical protein SAMN05216486_11023 [bacterium JGI 053]
MRRDNGIRICRTASAQRTANRAGEPVGFHAAGASRFAGPGASP